MALPFYHRHFTTIDSTNTWAKENAAQFSRQGVTLVTADMQTAGRGRFKRHWVSPPKQNIYATFCFFLDFRRADIANIPQVLALSALTILRERGFDAWLKWPNDLLISEKKVAGILAETTMIDQALCLILGIGLNVNMPLDLLQKIDRPATSLFVERGGLLDYADILKALQERFLRDLQIFLTEGFTFFLPDYRRYQSGNSAKLIRFDDNQKIWEGKFEAINEDGSLLLKLLDGSLKTFMAGEILF